MQDRSFFFENRALALSAIIPALCLMCIGLPGAEAITVSKHSYYDITDYGNDTSTHTIYSDGTPTRLLSNGQWVDYIITNDATKIQVETARGSIVYTKSTCDIKFYNESTITLQSTPEIFSDVYLAKRSTNGSGIWNYVPQVNNANCQASVVSSEGYAEIQVLRHKAGVGDFKIRYIKNFNQDWKTQLEPTNLSGLNDQQFGVTQIIAVPKIIQVGDTERDLSQFNNTVLDRAWIESHRAQLLDFKNGINFDFSLAYPKLESITINYYGNQTAKLSFDYTRQMPILPSGQTIVLDPTFGYTAATNVYTATTATAATVACPRPLSTLSGDGQTLRLYDSADPTGFCRVEASQWNISSIPVGATITSVNMKVTISATVSDRNCNLSGISNGDITSQTAYSLFNDITNNGTADPVKRYYLSNNSYCTTAGTKTLSLGTNGTTDVSNDLVSGKFAVGISPYSIKRDGTTHNLVSTDKQLQVTYTVTPGAITDLHSTSVTADSIDLAFTEPNLVGQTLINYMFNYTTPCGDPLTQLPNGTTATSYSIESLTSATCYSFRATAATTAGINADGNIVNVTTLAFNPGNFTVGSLSFDATNQDQVAIFFTKTVNSATNTTLTVTYPDTWNLACDFHYQFAMTNQTYTNLTQTVVSATQVSSEFEFTNPGNDVIDVRCWDQNDLLHNGKYLLTQADFVFLGLLQNFTAGEYGTEGNFGSIDIIFLFAIIISMIGLNRINESVGAAFCIMIMGGLAYFEIIQWETFAMASVALVVLAIILSTRKD